jgi:ABC-2 type transport system ATP-binding protein
MDTIVVSHIAKSFGKTQAVRDVSFNVHPGEIFGLLGPNGSGKTTSIRMLLDIYQPDHGSIEILGGPMDAEKLNKIGYLPEERGLYQDIEVARCLTYLGTLKGMTKEQIAERLPLWLERFDLTQHQKKKNKELSKGMQQKAQLIAALMHDPEIIIIDEPFSALDPVNTQLVKDLLIELRNLGKTIIMCTHQMNQVEMLCDRLVLIDHGRVLLEGSLQGVRERFSTNEILIQTDQELPAVIEGVEAVKKEGLYTRLKPAAGLSANDLLKTLMDLNIRLSTFEVAVPSLDEIFIQVVKNGGVENEENI